ncbi:MAG: DUF1501 domain-containing protein [Planctomycetota bacterium]
MNDNLDQLVSRRSFLRQGSCAALGLAGITNQVFALRSINAALESVATPFNDYKALICIFMFGGNDSGNTVIPWDGGDQNYADYAQERTTLALTPSELAPNVVAPSNTGTRRFAMHPAFAGVRDLFNQGNVAVLNNVGTLLFPMTRDDYRNSTVPRPSQLFGHNFQQEQWQLTRPDATDGLGWGGRIADMVQANGANPNASVSMNISIAGQSRFLAGRDVTAYSVGRNGPIGLDLNTSRQSQVHQAFLDMLAVQDDPTHPASTPMRKVIADISRRAVDNGALIDSLLDQPTVITTPRPDSNLGQQVQMVARLIEFGMSGLGHNRQVFFVSLGGFDNHNGLIGDPNGLTEQARLGPHGTRLKEVNDALLYLHSALTELGMLDQVTTFTASDFARTYRSNGNGSDHGWGSSQFVMGGSQVDGGKFYGQYNNILLGGPDDSSNTRGQFIPTTAVEQYGFELARWMGVPISEMDTVFPNVSRFLDTRDPATHLNILS